MTYIPTVNWQNWSQDFFCRSEFERFQEFASTNNDESVGAKIMRFARFLASFLKDGLKRGTAFATDFISYLVKEATSWLSRKALFGVDIILNNDFVYSLLCLVLVILALTDIVPCSVLIIVSSLLGFMTTGPLKKVVLALIVSIRVSRETYGQHRVNVVVHNNTVRAQAVVANNTTTLIYQSTLLFFASMFVWFLPKEKGFNTLINQLDKVPKALAGMENLADRFDYCFKYFQSKIGLELVGCDLTDPLPQEVRRNYDEVMRMSTRENFSEISANVQLATDIQLVYIDYMKLRRQYYNNRLVLQFLDQYHGATINLWQKVLNSNPSDNQRRQKPVTVFFRGGTGVGKSNLLYFLGTDILVELGHITSEMANEQILGRINSCMWARNWETEYCDGFNQQPICLYDDFGQLKDSLANPNLEFMELIRASNTFPWNLHMAELSAKANTFFESKFIIATTNLSRLEPVSIVDASALRSRIDCSFEVTIDPDVMIDSTSRDPAERKIDPQKVLAKYGSVFTPEIYRFQVWDALSGEFVGEQRTYEEIRDFVLGVYRSNVAFYQQSQETLVNHARARLNQPCLRAQSDLGQGIGYTLSPIAQDVRQAQDPPRRTGLVGWILGTSMRNRAHLNDDELVLSTRARMASFLRSKYDILKEKLMNKYVVGFLGIVAGTALFLKLYFSASSLFIEKKMDEIAISEQGLRFIVTNSVRALNSLIRDPSQQFNKAKVIGDYGPSTITAIQHFVDWRLRVDPQGSLVGPEEIFFPWKKEYPMKMRYYLACEEGEEGVPLCLDKHTLQRVLERSYEQAEVEVTEKPSFCFKILEFLQGDKTQMSCESSKDGIQPALKLESGEDFVQPALKIESGKDAIVQTVKLESGKDSIQPVLKLENGHLSCEQDFSQEGQIQKVRDCQPILSAEAYQSFQTQELADVVRKNFMLLRYEDGRRLCSVLFIKGRYGLINFHYVRGALAFLHKVKITPPGSQFGYELLASDIVRDGVQMTRNGHPTDLYLYEFPRQIPLFRDLTKNFIKVQDLDAVEGKYTILVVPTDCGTIYRTGKIIELVTQPQKVSVTKSLMMRFTALSMRADIRSEPGDCGGVYLLDSNVARGKIIGFHFAGDDTGGAYMFPLCESDFKIESLFLETPGLSSIAVPDSFMNVSAQGRIDIPVHSNTRTQIGKTPWFERVAKTTVCPAKLSQLLQEDGAGLKALQKVVANIPLLNQTFLDMACASYRAKMFSFPSPQTTSPLSFREAVEGLPDDPHIRGINRTKSAGYPWNYVHKNGKRDFFGSDEWCFDHPKAQQVQQTVAEWHDLVDKGVYVPSYYIDTLKDETRPIQKVAEGKTRLFAAAPMHFVILFRMYFMRWMAWIMANKIDNGTCVGIRAHSMEWHRLASKLRSKGEHVVGLDFTNFDGTLHPVIMDCVLQTIKDFYTHFGPRQFVGDPQWFKYLEPLWEDVARSWHIYCNVVLRWSHSNPSGQPGTTIVNSEYHKIALRYVYYWLANHFKIPIIPEFNDVVEEQVYGDDGVYNICDSIIDWFNQDTIALGFKQIGMKATVETKDDAVVTKTRKLNEVQFLKRGFRFESMISAYVGPLQMSSIFERTNWVKRPETLSPEVYKEMYRMIPMELALHDEDTYQKCLQKLNEGLKGFHYFPEYPRIHYLGIILNGTAYEVYPSLTFS